MMQVLILLFKLNYFSSAVRKIIIKNFISHNSPISETLFRIHNQFSSIDEMQNKTYIVTGTSNKLITYAKSKSTAKRRFSNHYPN